MKSTTKSTTKQKKKKTGAKALRSSSPSASVTSGTIYKDYAIFSGKQKPEWHPVKKMRYVFFRMIGGSTITDAIAEIHWNASEFWHLVDLKRHSVFREEYKRAKLLQGRAFADAVNTIAEGRDPISRRALRRLEKIVARALGKAGRQKSSLAVKAIMDGILSTIDVNDKGIVARNKLQMDAAKWIAKTANPSEFGDKSAVALGSPGGSGDTPADLRPLLIQFVDADGKVVGL